MGTREGWIFFFFLISKVFLFVCLFFNFEVLNSKWSWLLDYFLKRDVKISFHFINPRALGWFTVGSYHCEIALSQFSGWNRCFANTSTVPQFRWVPGGFIHHVFYNTCIKKIFLKMQIRGFPQCKHGSERWGVLKSDDMRSLKVDKIRTHLNEFLSVSCLFLMA